MCRVESRAPSLNAGAIGRCAMRVVLLSILLHTIQNRLRDGCCGDRGTEKSLVVYQSPNRITAIFRLSSRV